MKEKVNRALAVVLLAVIFVIGGATLATKARSLAYSVLKSYVYYLKEGSGPFGGVKARIDSLSDAINLNLFGKGFFEDLNLRFQVALGKQMYTFGSKTMVRLKAGQLYDLVETPPDKVDLAGEIGKMAALHEQLAAQGIPMIYAYAHSQLYRDNLLPDGVSDNNNYFADEIVSGLRACGIDTIDSREVMKDPAIPIDRITFRTDHHWSIYTAFDVYGEIVRRLQAQTGWAIDESIADLENFDVAVYPRKHFGEMGARLDASMVEPDDFPLIVPKFPTRIHRKISMGHGFEESDGSFAEAVLNVDMIPPEGEIGNCYDTYGLHNEIVYYVNEDAPEGRLLVVKDSYGTPASSFLALAVRDVCAVDLRKNAQKTVQDYIDDFQPDAVVFIQSQGMMTDKNYMIVEKEE